MLSRKTVKTIQDKLHRGFVYTSMGATVFLAVNVGVLFYNILTKGWPSHRRAMLEHLQESEDFTKYEDEFPTPSRDER